MYAPKDVLLLALALSLFALVLVIAPSVAPIAPAFAVSLVLLATLRSGSPTR